MKTVPLIDIGPLLKGGSVPGELVDAVHDACTRIGFLQLVGHGVRDDVLDAVYRSMNDLVRLPLDVKETLMSPTGHPFRGWSARRDATGQVQMERLQVCHFDSPDEARAAGIDPAYVDFFHPNVWPAQVPTVECAWRECFAATRLLGDRLMSLFARVLGVAPDVLSPRPHLDASCFAVNAYPAQPNSHGTGIRVLAGEHTDSGTLTILHQRGDYDGLQIHLADDEWISVPARADAFVINLGDLMARWTNGRWLSTRHRVVAANDERSSRMSIATFYSPPVDTVIVPLANCVGTEGPAFEPITPYVWERQFLAREARRLELVR